MNNYKGIIDYLKYISEKYNLQICINDFVGFLNIDKEFALILQFYMIHKNPFCMQIKSDKRLWDRCLDKKHGIMNKCRKAKETYYGMCYCGIEEYIVPIICMDTVIGAICAGEFCTNENISLYRISKVSKEYGMDTETLKENFHKSVQYEKHDKELINSLLGIIAEYISYFYMQSIPLNKNLPEKEPLNNHSLEHYILSHAIEYIKLKYHEQITVKDIARFCNCSESYISHIFKRNMKINVKAYINKIRIDQAKLIMKSSNESIGEIASKIGFNDPNYFSNVFSNICGITATSYRKCIEPQ